MSPRTLAIGDIHGCHQALVQLLAIVQPAADDTVVVLGDFVDRGPDSCRVIDELLRLQSQCRLVALLGNHEEMFRDQLMGRGLSHLWRDAGGKTTLQSYGGSLDNIPPTHVRFLMSLAPYFQTEREIFVHAALEPGVTLKNQTAQWLRWKHLAGSERRYAADKLVVCGHTPQHDGYPWVWDGWVCLDTCPQDGKFLTCLDTASNLVYQASQTGETRSYELGRLEGYARGPSAGTA